MAQTTTDKLTENGILTDHPDVTMLDYEDLHGSPWHEDDQQTIFVDQHGYELDEWADAIGMERGELATRMRDLADDHGANDGLAHWGARDPVVFDARTFADED